MVQDKHRQEILEHVRYSLAQRLEAAALLSPLVLGAAAGVYIAEKDTGKVETQCIQACGEAAMSDVLLGLPIKSSMPSRKTVGKPSAKPSEALHSSHVEPSASKTKQLPTPTTVAASAVRPHFAREAAIRLSGQGFDISWPQCATDTHSKRRTSHISPKIHLHKSDFAIVGLNGGKDTNANVCLAEELAAAQQVAGARVAVYVNTSNPVKDADKAREHGQHAAEANIRRIKRVTKFLKVPLQPFVWLDVERGNTWQKDNAAGHASNVAMLEGAVKTYLQAGLQVGIYTAKDEEARPRKLNMWKPIMGAVAPTSILNVPEWIASPDANGCTEKPFIAGGQVVLRQNVINDLDIDRTC
ncbi:MAG TPA: hypothetical protein VFI84_02845 [Candidatus Saccharimonadales bacterium]|nr:hypothetical protein [Candidatus Saccharimonadales bacterium]